MREPRLAWLIAIGTAVVESLIFFVPGALSMILLGMAGLVLWVAAGFLARYLTRASIGILFGAFAVAGLVAGLLGSIWAAVVLKASLGASVYVVQFAGNLVRSMALGGVGIGIASAVKAGAQSAQLPQAPVGLPAKAPAPIVEGWQPATDDGLAPMPKPASAVAPMRAPGGSFASLRPYTIAVAVICPWPFLLNLVIPMTGRSDAIFQGIQYFALLVLAGALAAWVHRANTNCRALGSEPTRYTAGASAGSFFVPIANIVFSGYILEDIWTHSTAPTQGRWPFIRAYARVLLYGMLLGRLVITVFAALLGHAGVALLELYSLALFTVPVMGMMILMQTMKLQDASHRRQLALAA